MNWRKISETQAIRLYEWRKYKNETKKYYTLRLYGLR